MATKPYIKLTDLKQLPAVSFSNIQALRELAAKARTLRDFRAAHKLDRQAGKWERQWKEAK